MKRFRKITAISVAIAMMISLLAGCSIDELKLLNALKKTATINSMRSEAGLSLEMSSLNLNRDQNKMFAPIINMLDGSEIKTVSQLNANDAKTIMKIQDDVSLSFGDVNTSFSLWFDYDNASLTKKNKMIIQLPSIAKSFVPVPAIKKYWYINAPTAAPATTAPSVSPDPSASPAPTISPAALNEKMTNLMYDLALKFNIGFNMINRLPDETAAPETLEVYQLSLDDKIIKDVLRYLGTTYASDKEVTDLIKNNLISMIDSTSSAKEAADIKKQIEDSITSFQNNHSTFTRDFNNFMDDIANMNILGSKGFKIIFKVNEDGYVVSTEAVMDLALNLTQMQDVFSGLPAATPLKGGSLNLTFNYSDVLSDINEDVSVAIPTLTPSNSFDMMNLPKMLTSIPVTLNPITTASTSISGYTEAGTYVTVQVYSSYIDFLTSASGKKFETVAKSNGTFYVPINIKLKYGDTVFVTVDNDYTTSIKYDVVYLDKTPPNAPIVNNVTHNSKFVTGRAEHYTKLYIKSGNKIIALGKATFKNTFKIAIAKQKAGKILRVIAKDASGNYSKWTSKVVL